MRPTLIAVTIILLFGTAWAAPATKSDAAKTPCVDVQIGNDRTAFLECLNGAFQRDVQREHQNPQIEAPIGAQSPPNQVGTFNEQAARQQMGSSFGVSGVPQRPKPVFNNPFPPTGPH